MLGWHVQQQGLTAAALRAFEAERIPRVKEVFGLTDKHAAKMKAGRHSCHSHFLIAHCCVLLALLSCGALVMLVSCLPYCLLLCQLHSQQTACKTQQHSSIQMIKFVDFLKCCCLHLHTVTGVPQRELLMERAELLYGQVKFKPLDQRAPAAAAAMAAVPASAASAWKLLSGY